MKESLTNDPVGKSVHVGPQDTRFHGLENGLLLLLEFKSKKLGITNVLSGEDGLIDEFLVGRKFAICRKRARDIGAIAIVLCPHIKQHHISIAHLFAIWCALIDKQG